MLLIGLALAPFAWMDDARAEPPLARSEPSGPLSQAEMARMSRGETVVRPETVNLEGKRYVGGVTYTIVDMSEEELISLMDNEAAYGHVLPRVKFLKRISFTPPDVYMEVHHGNALIDAAYTMHLRREPELARIRFWVDLTRPHDVDDAWGFFRYQELPAIPPSNTPRLLLTYGALVNLGDGILRALYEPQVLNAMLSVPQRLRRYVARRRRE